MYDIIDGSSCIDCGGGIACGSQIGTPGSPNPTRLLLPSLQRLRMRMIPALPISFMTRKSEEMARESKNSRSEMDHGNHAVCFFSSKYKTMELAPKCEAMTCPISLVGESELSGPSYHRQSTWEMSIRYPISNGVRRSCSNGASFVPGTPLSTCKEIHGSDLHNVLESTYLPYTVTVEITGA